MTSLLTQSWHILQLVLKYATDVTNELKLMPLQFQVLSVSNWLGFKLLQFETKVSEWDLSIIANSLLSLTVGDKMVISDTLPYACISLIPIKQIMLNYLQTQ